MRVRVIESLLVYCNNWKKNRCYRIYIHYIIGLKQNKKLIALRFPRICLIYAPKKNETKIFQKTIISPVFLPASRYFIAILNIALRHWIHTIHKWALFIEMYCILLIISSILFSAVDDFNLKKLFQFKKQNEKLKHYEGEHCKNCGSRRRLPSSFAAWIRKIPAF